MAIKVPGRLHDPAVHIQLVLFSCRVRSPHRQTLVVARHAFDLALAVTGRAVERVEDVHFGHGEAACDLQPAQKCLCLLRASRGHEGAGSDARVARPRVAVVPVELAAQPLRQGGRRRRHRSARGRIGEQAQRDQAPDHGRPEGTGVFDLGRPPPPVAIRLLDEHERLLARNENGRRPIGQRGDERE